MTDFRDYDLHKDRETPRPGLPAKSTRPLPWVLGAAALLVGAGALGYLFFRPAPAPIEADAPAPIPAAPPPTLVVEPDPFVDVTVPPLGESDGVVRDLVRRLSSHPTVVAWLATDRLIGNFTVVTMNIADRQTPAQHLRAISPRGAFRVVEKAGTVYIDARSYERYDGHAAAVAGLDARGTARLYATLEPRILEAARELGYTGADFDPVLERAIVELLRTPVIDADIEVRRGIISYAYVDPQLEGLSAAQRQFLRMGPHNVRDIQSKLRDIAREVGIPPTRLPPPR